MLRLFDSLVSQSSLFRFRWIIGVKHGEMVAAACSVEKLYLSVLIFSMVSAFFNADSTFEGIPLPISDCMLR